MRLRRCALPVVLLGLAGAAAAAAPDAASLDELLRLLSARQHGHVAFTEVQELAVLERPLESSGELTYEAPDRLVKRTLKPKAETLTLDHGVLSAQRGHRTYVLELRAYPQVVPFVESIRATLAGDRATLERLFNVGFEGALAGWTLELTPRDAALAAAVKDIRISGEHANIRTVEIRQSDGDRSLLTLGPELTP